MKKSILNIGTALTKTEQKTINGGFFGEECGPDPRIIACTDNAQCHAMNYGMVAICQFGCCLTPL